MSWLDRDVPFIHNPSCHKDVGWKDIRIPTQTWLVLCCICGCLGFVFGLAMDSCTTYWLPSPVRRVVQYLQALKTIGWDEYALSSFFQVQTGVPLATVSAGSLFAISRYFIAGQKLSMAQIKEALYTPVRKVTPQVFSPVKEVRRALFDLKCEEGSKILNHPCHEFRRMKLF